MTVYTVGTHIQHTKGMDGWIHMNSKDHQRERLYHVVLVNICVIYLSLIFPRCLVEYIEGLLGVKVRRYKEWGDYYKYLGTRYALSLLLYSYGLLENMYNIYNGGI